MLGNIYDFIMPSAFYLRVQPCKQVTQHWLQPDLINRDFELINKFFSELICYLHLFVQVGHFKSETLIELYIKVTSVISEYMLNIKFYVKFETLLST
jgi:hypothetical protein